MFISCKCVFASSCDRRGSETHQEYRPTLVYFLRRNVQYSGIDGLQQQQMLDSSEKGHTHFYGCKKLSYSSSRCTGILLFK